MPETTVLTSAITPVVAYGETSAIDGGTKRGIDMTGMGRFLFKRVTPFQDTNLPATTDVRLNVPVGNSVGRLVLPIVGDVRLAVGYGVDGTSLVGTLPQGVSPIYTLSTGKCRRRF